MAAQWLNPAMSSFEQLRKVIELPENCRSFTIQWSIDAMPVVTATYIPDENRANGDRITQRFALTPISGEVGRVVTLDGER